MSWQKYFVSSAVFALLWALTACGGGSASTGSVQLAIAVSGTGSGSVSSTPSGIQCGSVCDAQFNSGTQVTLTAVPGGNSTFSGWSGACSGQSLSCVVMLTGNTKISASFSSNPVPLKVLVGGTGKGTVSSSPAGIQCGTACSADFDAGTKVTLTASSAGGSTFGGWSGACAGTSPTCVVVLNVAAQVDATFDRPIPVQLSVVLTGAGSGTVTSSPPGINCGTTCSANFSAGTQMTLTAAPSNNSSFGGWSGGCTGMSTNCVFVLNSATQVNATFGPPNVDLLNHVIFMAQENRAFDHYFGALRAYWAKNGIADQSFDGLPQFNPVSGDPPLQGPPPSVPGCDPAFPPPSDCVYDNNSPQIASYALITQCIENPSPSWNESHVDWNLTDPLSGTATLDGFVHTAAHDARTTNPPFYDTNGIRAMGYYDENSLNYYYFMATAFGTSDRWFSPTMTRTHPNREYMIAATSQGYVYPVGTNHNDTQLLTAPTIFQELQQAGITWRIYVDPKGSSCTGPPYNPACLLGLSYVQNFKWGQSIPTLYPQNIAPISQFFTDLQNGTLPQVVQIEPASDAGLDEHPTTDDSAPTDLQKGAQYVSTLINGLMASSYWKDSAFILTFDEFGGLYDHVPPQPAVSPDGIKPVDLMPGDICTKGSGPTCDFTYTGYRLPLVVVSPYARKNYVSHTVADLTAILKLLETRFNLPPLTRRDAAQMDMTEFFDFSDPPWMTPPSPPAQFTNGPCYVNQLP